MNPSGERGTSGIRGFVQQSRFEVSMSGKGNCYDNSPLGRFTL
jgi:hypothetical protein